jgi:hypothetical protein
MKNIYILPTTESSRLKDENLYSNPSYVLSREPLHWRYAVHMYITSEDEDIYENDYIITQEGKLVQVSYLLSSDIYKSSKVIMTTSQKLIEDGVQEIDDTFIQWFIVNFKCEYVQVKKQYITPLGDVVETCYDNERLNYKIIIPEEEPKYVFGITKGFNKAMELNKDKLFTLEDMKAIFAFGHVVGMNNILAIQSQHSPQPLPKPDSDKLRDEVIQSLQQPTEIEVTFNPDKKDSEGCLILTKI